MFRQSICAILLIFLVHKGWALKCFQCQEMDYTNFAVDERCKDPNGKDAYSKSCSANEVCVKYTHPKVEVATVATEPTAARFCGNLQDCKAIDKQAAEDRQQRFKEVEQLAKLQSPAEQKVMLEQARQIFKSFDNATGGCHVCDTDLCNSSSAVYPSFIVVSVFFVIKYFL